MDCPLVSIITVNFNQWEETCELLRSLERITYSNWEVIVVDNGSETKAPDEIEGRFPSVRFLFTKKISGFAGGNNFALADCTGDYILFLNNDVEVEPDFGALGRCFQLFFQNWARPAQEFIFFTGRVCCNMLGVRK